MADEREPQVVAPSSNRKKWILISAGSLVLILALSAAGAWLAGLLPFGQEAQAKGSAEPARPEVNQVISLPPVVFNLAASRKMTYARIGVSLGVHARKPEIPVINQDLLAPRVTDELLNSVGGMTPEELLRAETKTALKEQVAAYVNSLLPAESGKVVEVYFTEFIVQ